MTCHIAHVHAHVHVHVHVRRPTRGLTPLHLSFAGLQKAVEEQKRILADDTHTYNWAQTAMYETSRFRFPDNEAEVVALIKGHDKVRSAGALHSSSPLSQQEADGGIIISTRLLDKIIEIDEASMTVTCEAGCILLASSSSLSKKKASPSPTGALCAPRPRPRALRTPAPLPYTSVPLAIPLWPDRPPDDGWGPHDGDAWRISPPCVHRIDDTWLPHGSCRRLD
jgi:hypothetical protein